MVFQLQQKIIIFLTRPKLRDICVMTLVIVHKVIQNLLVKLSVLKVLYNCIKLCVRITAECNTWKMFDFIFRNNIPWEWSHKVSRNKTSNNMYSVCSLWRMLLSRVHVPSSTQRYMNQLRFINFTKCLKWTPSGEAVPGRIFFLPPLNSDTTKLIRKDLVLDSVKNKCNVGDLRLPPRCLWGLRCFGISRNVEW